MSLDPYAISLKTIKNDLRAKIRTTESFPEHVYWDYIVPESLSPDANPIVMLGITEDRFKAIGAKETRHDINMTIEVIHVSDYTEESLNDLIGFMGEIVDAIEQDRKLGDSHYIENTEIDSITYGFEDNNTALVRHALMRITVIIIRNM